MTDTASAAPSEREQFEVHATERGYKLARGPNDSYQYRDASVAWKAWQAARAQPTPPAVVEPRMPVGNATLERLREWERDGELLERVWGTLVDQETEIGQLRAAARVPTDSQPAAAVKPACCIPPEREGEYHRPGEAITASREPMAGWEPVYRAARAPADSVLEDAARLDWLALAGPTSICVVIDRPHDSEVEVATDDVTGYGKTLREALDAARKQGAKP